MEKITDRLRNPIIGVSVGAILGLILGLIIGWGIWPVQYTDVEPQHLREELKGDYLCMVIDSYAKNAISQEAQIRAKQRYDLLGASKGEVLSKLDTVSCGLSPESVAQFKKNVGATETSDIGITPVVQATSVMPMVTEETAATGKVSPIVIGVLCLATLAVGVVLGYILLFRKKPARAGAPVSAANQAMEMNKSAQVTDYTEQSEGAPVSQFVTTYINGDDLYDDSFSIDSPTGEFLGECGVGISDTIGVGDPKKVTALEVWLFDKNDIQTVTKVLMSHHAFTDEGYKTRLASKGDAVELTPGREVIMETETLVLKARVVDMTYGEGSLPAGSFFDRLTLELAIWQKPKA